MLGRIAVGVWAVLATVGLVVFATGGSLHMALVLDGIAGTVAAVALLGVVKIPWDLYFAARNVQVEQRESVAAGITVGDAEQREVNGLTRRLLGMAVGLHLLGAAVCAAAWLVFDGRLGLFAAAAFLVTMLLRPTAAMVQHVRRRLGELHGRARLPRLDSHELDRRLARTEALLSSLDAQVRDDHTGLAALDGRTHALHDELRRAVREQHRRHQAELDRLGLETERALEKLTRDREVLAGLRAFLQMVRAT